MWLLFERESVRLDESQSLWVVHHSWEFMTSLVARDVHMPLYFALLKLWTTVLGNSLVFARLFSLLWALLAIPVAYMLGQAMGSRRLAVIAAVLYATSPFVHWYSSEVRMYSLLIFLASLHAYFFYRLLSGRGSRWSVLGAIITAVLGVYTHYFFWLVIAADSLAYLAYRNRRHSLDRQFWIMVSVCIVSLMPWIWVVEHQPVRALSEPLLPRPSTVDIFITIFQFILGFLESELNTVLLSLWPALILILFFTLSRRQLAPRPLLYPLLIFLVPIIGTVLISYLARPVYAARYLAVAMPGFILLVGWLIIALGKTVGRVAFIVVVVVSIGLSFRQGLVSGMPLKENFVGAQNIIAKNNKPGDVVYVTAPFTTYPMEYYQTSLYKIRTIPSWNRFEQVAIPGFTAEGLANELNASVMLYKRAWLITSFDQGYEDEIIGTFNSRFKQLDYYKLSGVDVYLYEL
jgi:mannosyltransferase